MTPGKQKQETAKKEKEGGKSAIKIDSLEKKINPMKRFSFSFFFLIQ